MHRGNLGRDGNLRGNARTGLGGAAPGSLIDASCFVWERWAECWSLRRIRFIAWDSRLDLI
jgi:hypothetical protein